MSESLPKISPKQDPDRYFRTDHLEADLKGRSIRSGIATMGSQVCLFVLNMGSLVILARMLSPEDFGLIAMVATVTGFLELFKDLGLSTATIQRAEITHQQVSTLFWVNVVVSAGIMVLTAVLAPAIAWFYGEPRLVGITLVLASGFIFGGLTAQHQALLKRQMRFATLAAIDISSMLVGVITAIGLASYGFGYWSLVFMRLAMSITNYVGVWLTCQWRPGLPQRRSGVRSMLAFGGHLTGFNVVNYFTRNFDNIIIGWYKGAGQLGLYANAYKLLLLPINQINVPMTSVALPTLSRLQNDPERYRAYYCKGILLTVTFGMPLVAFLGATADKIILVALGAEWKDAILLFQLLVPAAFLGTFNMAMGWVYTSLGKADRQFRWNLVVSAFTVLCFLVGVRWGAAGVALGYSFSVVVLRIPGAIYCYKDSPLQLKDLLVTIWRPAFASISAALALALIDKFILVSMSLQIGLLLDCLLYGLLYLTIWILLPNGKQTLLGIVRMAKELKAKPKES